MLSRICSRWALILLLIGQLTRTIFAAEGPARKLSQSAAADGTVPLLDASKAPWQTVTVDKTYNNAPFDYQIKLQTVRNGYRVYHVKYPFPVRSPLAQNNTVPAEYYLPDDIAPGVLSRSAAADGTVPFPPKRPAVICLHILDNHDILTDMVCAVLARRGVPAIMFKLPYYGQRGTADGPLVLAKDPKLFAAAIAQAGEDFRRTIDLLASRPEVDPKRICVSGISLGGIVAATAAGGEPRIHRAAFVLSGGDLLKIVHHARETRLLSEMIMKLPPPERAELEAKIAAVDPLRFAPALKEKARQGKIMMINAEEDEVIPRACTEKLAAAMEMNDRVVWIKGLGHYTSMAELPQNLNRLADFFAQDLPPGMEPPVIVKNQNAPLQILAGLMQQIAAIIDSKPEDGRCHVVDLEIAIVPNGKKSPLPLGVAASQQSPLPLGEGQGEGLSNLKSPLPTNLRSVPGEGKGEGQGEGTQKGRFRLVRGSQNRFAIFCKLPFGGEISFGQNDHPWLATGGKEVLDGTANPGQTLKDLPELLDPRQVKLLCMLAGLLNGAAMAPEVLDRLVIVKDDGTIEGNKAIRIIGRENFPFNARLILMPNGNTPQSLTINLPGTEWKVKILDWQINAVAQDAFFQPPADLPRRQVDQSFIYTLVGTSLKFALPTTE